MKTKILLSIAMLIMIINACSDGQKKIIVGQDGKTYVVLYSTPFKNFGNGIYYYSSSTSCNDFGPALATFVGLNKSLKIVSISLLVEEGNSRGYWIITEPKILCPCDSVN